MKLDFSTFNKKEKTKNRVTFNNVTPSVKLFLKKYFTTNEDAKTQFLENSVLAAIEKEGYALQPDGTVLPKVNLNTSIDEPAQPKGEVKK